MEFHVVDVFSSQLFRGNPVLVALPPQPLEFEQMQQFAAWNGMPETVFLQPLSGRPNGYTARIFSPRAELAFAGHPSLGAAKVAIEAGLVKRPGHATDENAFGNDLRATTSIWQHCLAGEVELRQAYSATGAPCLFVKTPVQGQVRALGVDAADLIAQALGTRPEFASFLVNAGARWIVVPLKNATTLHALAADMSAIESLSTQMGVSGITAFAPAEVDDAARFEVRSFGPAIGVPEDAACGGGNACLAVVQQHLEPTTDPVIYTTVQGRFVGRNCRVRIVGPVGQNRFWLGGAVRMSMRGRMASSTHTPEFR